MGLGRGRVAGGEDGLQFEDGGAQFIDLALQLLDRLGGGRAGGEQKGGGQPERPVFHGMYLFWSSPSEGRG